jgi:hypothetical protein
VKITINNLIKSDTNQTNGENSIKFGRKRRNVKITIQNPIKIGLQSRNVKSAIKDLEMIGSNKRNRESAIKKLMKITPTRKVGARGEVARFSSGVQ